MLTQVRFRWLIQLAVPLEDTKTLRFDSSAMRADGLRCTCASKTRPSAYGPVSSRTSITRCLWVPQ